MNAPPSWVCPKCLNFRHRPRPQGHTSSFAEFLPYTVGAQGQCAHKIAKWNTAMHNWVVSWYCHLLSTTILEVHWAFATHAGDRVFDSRPQQIKAVLTGSKRLAVGWMSLDLRNDLKNRCHVSLFVLHHEEPSLLNGHRV